jgi:plasmid maintenance system antidote protein VapI
MKFYVSFDSSKVTPEMAEQLMRALGASKKNDK